MTERIVNNFTMKTKTIVGIKNLFFLFGDTCIAATSISVGDLNSCGYSKKKYTVNLFI